MNPVYATASFAAYKMDAIRSIAETLDKRDLRELFAGLTKEEILAVIKEAIILKNPSILFIICHIPESKFHVLLELKDITFAIDSCASNEDIERFLNIVSPEQAKVLIKIPLGNLTTTDESLEVPLCKARRAMGLLSAQSYRTLICLHPLLLVVAIKAKTDIVVISKYLSSKQLRFVARFANESFIDDVIGFLIKNELGIKLYALLKGLALDSTSVNSFTFKQYASKFNKELIEFKNNLEKKVEEASKIKNALNERKIKALREREIRAEEQARAFYPKNTFSLIEHIKHEDSLSKNPSPEEIPLGKYASESERIKLESLANRITIISSETFQACIAAYRMSPDLLTLDIVALDILNQKAITLLFDPPILIDE